MKNTLKESMMELMQWAYDYAIANLLTTDNHSDLFHATATHFDLYINDHAPTWLSRVIDGLLRDMEFHSGDLKREDF